MHISRRSFVSSALAASGLAAFPGCSSFGANTKTRVAVQLYSVRELIWAEGLPPVLAELKKMGYEGVEMAGYYTKDKKPITAAELKKMLDDAGLIAFSSRTVKKNVPVGSYVSLGETIGRYGFTANTDMRTH